MDGIADPPTVSAVVVDAGLGNVGSVVNMARRAGSSVVVSDDPETIASAPALIFPGVGHWDGAASRLSASGLDSAMRSAVDRGSPLLGICLGMQLLFKASEEGQQAGLNLVDGRVVRFHHDPAERPLKVPHMGWNIVRPTQPDPLTSELGDEPRFYFVHSYHVAEVPPSEQLLTAAYGYEFVCGVRRENVWGVQFHPEKSHRFGMTLIANFFRAAATC